MTAEGSEGFLGGSVTGEGSEGFLGGAVTGEGRAGPDKEAPWRELETPQRWLMRPLAGPGRGSYLLVSQPALEAHAGILRELLKHQGVHA